MKIPSIIKWGDTPLQGIDLDFEIEIAPLLDMLYISSQTQSFEIAVPVTQALRKMLAGEAK